MTDRIIGLDLSVTHTGVAIWSPDDSSWNATTLKPPDKLRGSERLAWLRASLKGLLGTIDDGELGPDRLVLAVIEGYAYSARGRGIYQLAEWGGLVRLILHDLTVPVVDLTPQQLKKLATGKANADKAAVGAAAARRLDADPGDEHQADAIWLAAAGHILLGLEPLPRLPQVHLSALDAIAMPPNAIAVPSNANKEASSHA